MTPDELLRAQHFEQTRRLAAIARQLADLVDRLSGAATLAVTRAAAIGSRPGAALGRWHEVEQEFRECQQAIDGTKALFIDIAEQLEGGVDEILQRTLSRLPNDEPSH